MKYIFEVHCAQCKTDLSVIAESLGEVAIAPCPVCDAVMLKLSNFKKKYESRNNTTSPRTKDEHR